MNRTWRETRRAGRCVRVLWHLLVAVGAAHGVLPLMHAARLPRRHDIQRRMVRAWMRKLCRILGLRIHVTGAIDSRPTLFVANHVSWLDIPCLLATVDAAFIAKHEVAAWPVIGRMAARIGTLFLRRGHGSSARTGDRMTWRLAQGQHLAIFPEGTTTDGTRIGRFHARLYQAAIRTHSRVQAVAIAYPHAHGVNPAAPFVGDDDLLRHLWSLLAEREIAVQLTFCPPVPAAGRERRALADATRAQILAALGLAPACGDATGVPHDPDFMAV